MPVTNPAPVDPDDINELLKRYWAGETELRGRLFAALIDPMRQLAARRLATQKKNYPMVQKTMIAIDAIEKLLNQTNPVQNLEHAMKLGKRFTDWIIEDYHRKERVREARELPPSDQHPEMPKLPAIDPIDLLDCLRRLEGVSTRAAEVVRLRLLSGCTIDEAGEALGVTHSTIEKQFRFALQFLRKCLAGRGSSDSSSTWA
jgi:RNA polymerase sigma factor (sigma-70 family)